MSCAVVRARGKPLQMTDQGTDEALITQETSERRIEGKVQHVTDRY